MLMKAFGGRDNENKYNPHHHKSAGLAEDGELSGFSLVEHRGKNERGSIYRHDASGIEFYQDKRRAYVGEKPTDRRV